VLPGLSHASFMTTFFFEELAARHPRVSFVHAYPGEVITPEFQRAEFPVAMKWFFFLVVLPILKVTGQTFGYEEVGERMMFDSVSARFPPKEVADGGDNRMLPLSEGMDAIAGSDGESASGSYCVSCTGDKVDNATRLAKLRAQDARSIIWEHTVAIFEGIKPT